MNKIEILKVILILIILKVDYFPPKSLSNYTYNSYTRDSQTWIMKKHY